MTSLDYMDIYNDFLGYIKDFELIKLEDDEFNELMLEYLKKALSKPYLRKLFTTLTLNEEFGCIEFEMATITDEESDLYFVKDILSRSMVIEWLEPRVKNVANLNQFFGGKEQKYFSQAQHLTALTSLLESTKNDVRKTIMDRGYMYNSYLGAQE